MSLVYRASQLVIKLSITKIIVHAWSKYIYLSKSSVKYNANIFTIHNI